MKLAIILILTFCAVVREAFAGGIVVPPTQTVFELIQEDATLSNFEAGLVATGLSTELNTSVPFTSFSVNAPTNAAFDAYWAQIGETVTEVDCLRFILNVHIERRNFGPGPFGGERRRTEGVLATNGELNVVDEVEDGSILANPNDIESSVSTFFELIATAGLSSVFGSPCTNITLFVPDDSAFEEPASLVRQLEFIQMGAANGDGYLTGLLVDIVETHVVTSAVLRAEDIAEMDAVIATNGQTLDIDAREYTQYSSRDDYLEFVDGVRVSSRNNIVGRSIVHSIIRGLLLPDDLPNKTIVEVASELPSLTSLVGALSLVPGGLLSVLDSPLNNSWTVFAPTDAAFVAALELLGVPVAELADNAALIATVLNAHIVETGLLEADLGETIMTRGGEEIPVSSIQLSATKDVRTLNGVVHVINNVIVPPSLAGLLTTAPSAASVTHAPVIVGAVLATLASRV